jgi:hypothetical protein
LPASDNGKAHWYLNLISASSLEFLLLVAEHNTECFHITHRNGDFWTSEGVMQFELRELLIITESLVEVDVLVVTFCNFMDGRIRL